MLQQKDFFMTFTLEIVLICNICVCHTNTPYMCLTMDKYLILCFADLQTTGENPGACDLLQLHRL